MNYTTAQTNASLPQYGHAPSIPGPAFLHTDVPAPSTLLDAVRALNVSLDPQHRLISDLQDVLSPVRRQAEEVNKTVAPAVPLPAPLAELRSTPAGEELMALFHNLTDVTNRLISLRASLAL